MIVPEPGPCCFTGAAAFRAINVQLASGDERPGRTVVIVALVLALSLDVEVDRIRDPLVSTARCMLVDQRSSLAVMPHPRHQGGACGAAGPASAPGSALGGPPGARRATPACMPIGLAHSLRRPVLPAAAFLVLSASA